LKYVSGRLVRGIYKYLVGFGAGKWPSQQEMVCTSRAVSGQQVVEGDGVYKCESSETSAIRTQTPGNYPKTNKLHLEHGESLKTSNYAFSNVHDPSRCQERIL